MTKKEELIYYGTGRRKSSVARVRLVKGEGKIVVNDRDVREYMPYETLVMDMKQPLTLTKTENDFDVIATVKGGGNSGQAGAIRLGIARALLDVSKDYRAILKAHKMLRRDARKVERKKYGLKKSRKAPQFSKR
mgnify:CR=1 FL=1